MKNLIEPRKNTKAIIFTVKLVAVYFIWKTVHHFLLETDFLLHPLWVNLVEKTGSLYAFSSAFILRLLNENVTQAGIGFQFHPSLKIVYVEEHCLAFPAMLIFSSAILFYEGNWREKLWFIPIGLLAIILINLVRLVALGLAFEYLGRFFFSINHSYVYVVITYSLILFMIIWWMDRVAPSQ